jgi:hypothetical protein
MGDGAELQGLEKRPIICLSYHGAESLYYKEKQHGQQGVPLTQPVGVPDLRGEAPVTVARVLAEARSGATQSNQIVGKPKWCSSSKRKGQATESKAREISAFRSMHDRLRLCRSFTEDCTK